MSREKSILVFYPDNFYQMSAGTHRRIFDVLVYLKKRNFFMDLLSLDGFTENIWNLQDKERKDFFNTIQVCEWKYSYMDKFLERKNRTGIFPDYSIYNLRKKFKEMRASRKYSFILISYAYWAALADLIGDDTVKIIDLHDFITLSNFMLTNRRDKLGRMFEGETNAIIKYDYAFSISEEETLMLSQFCPRTEFLDIPVFFPRRFQSGKNFEFDVLFIGSDNQFNIDGMNWFMDNVYHLLSPSVRIVVVGKISEQIDKKDNITIIPHVASTDEIYKKVKLSICPLQAGTGLKVKVIESLSYGIPVITTDWGLRGILQKKNNGCLLANSGNDFAKAIDTVLSDRTVYEELKKQVENFFSNNYSEQIVYRKLDRIFLPDGCN